MTNLNVISEILENTQIKLKKEKNQMRRQIIIEDIKELENAIREIKKARLFKESIKNFIAD